MQYKHVKYWLGIHLREYFPDMATGPHAELVSPYFQNMRLLVTQGLVLGDFTVGTIRSVTAKAFYQGFTSTFPPPKVIFKYNVDWSLVWKRLEYLVIEPFAKDVLFSIIHKHFMDMEAVWLMTTFLEYVWLDKFVKKNKVKIEHLIGFMKLRFKANQVSKKPSLGFISMIS